MPYNENYDIVYHSDEDTFDIEDFNENFSVIADELDSAANLTAGKANINHSHNLNSSNLTGALPVSKGGTGAVNSVNARRNLGLGNAAELDYTDSISDGTSDNLTTESAVLKALNEYSYFTAIKNKAKTIYVNSNDASVSALVNDLTALGFNVYSNLAAAVSNAEDYCDIVLLPGTHFFYPYIDLTEKSNITIRGLNESCKYTCKLICSSSNEQARAVLLKNSDNIVLKDFGLLVEHSESAIQGAGTVKNAVFKNLYIYSGSTGIYMADNTGFVQGISIENCVFKKSRLTSTLTGSENTDVYIIPGTTVSGTYALPSVIRVGGNISASGGFNCILPETDNIIKHIYNNI